jgi:hypothetical protein
LGRGRDVDVEAFWAVRTLGNVTAAVAPKAARPRNFRRVIALILFDAGIKLDEQKLSKFQCFEIANSVEVLAHGHRSW